MEILSPVKVKESKGLYEKFTSERIQKLAKEESRLTKSIGVLRVELQRQLKRVEIATNDAYLIVRKSILASEVEHLEQKKKDALVPLAKKERELREKELDIVAQRNSLQLETSQNIEEKQRLGAVKSSLEERERNIVEKEDSLDLREHTIVKSEEQITISTGELAKKWVEFNEQKLLLDEREKQLASKETDLSMREKTLDTQKTEQEERTRKQDERDREISSKWQALSVAQSQPS